MYTSSMRRVQLLIVCGMGVGDINDNNFLLNITVDIKVVLFSLTHAVLILTWFVNFFLYFLFHNISLYTFLIYTEYIYIRFGSKLYR